MANEPEVLIVGAGPTGLVLAFSLARQGVRARIIDRNAGPGLASRAMVVQARTLEFYGQLGIGDGAIARGIQVQRAHVMENGREVATFSLSDTGQSISAYPFALCFPQDEHERFLVDQLALLGIRIGWETELLGFEARDDCVVARLSGRSGEETCRAAYLCGCDGAHTRVRQELGIGFPGGTYDQLFFVADVRVSGRQPSDLWFHIGPSSLVLMLPARASGTQRLIGIVPRELSDRADLTFEDVRPGAEQMLGLQVLETNWFSTYRVHHRVAERFRQGRVFIAGDAGHLHSPAGGQGMNTGIGDAVNLAWKLANSLKGRTSPAVLDSYEPERIAFARTLVRTTDRAFRGMTGEGWGSRVLRSWLVPLLAPAFASIPAVRRAAFLTVSQTRISYRESPLSEGRVGSISGGDRLPWTGVNYASLAALDWRLHVYGEVAGPLAAAAAGLGVAVDAFPWNEAAERAGIHRDAAYLVRPDGHVALASPDQDPALLKAYGKRIGLAHAANAQRLA